MCVLGGGRLGISWGEGLCHFPQTHGRYTLSFQPYPRTNDDDLGGTTIGTSPQSDLAADDVFDDPYSTDVDEDALSELRKCSYNFQHHAYPHHPPKLTPCAFCVCPNAADGGFLRGILKAAGASSSPEGSVSSASVSCDESSKGVRFTLPDGHVDAPERAPVDKYHVRSTPMDPAGMTLQELINRYSKGTVRSVRASALATVSVQIHTTPSLH